MLNGSVSIFLLGLSMNKPSQEHFHFVGEYRIVRALPEKINRTMEKEGIEDSPAPNTIAPAEGAIELVNPGDDGDGDGDRKALVESSAIIEAPKRETWGSKLAYLLTLVGYAVGFGNIWRFPYMMRENGGLAFMIPYCFMLTFVGIPTFFLELAIGQRRRKGIIYCWSDVKPSLGGVGICCGWVTFMIGLYYNTLLAYCISYLVDALFYYPLPWSSCQELEDFNPGQGIKNECEIYLNKRPSKYYWFRGTLGISTGIDVPGDFNWPLAGYLIAAWSIIWAVLLNGKSTVEVIVYFTASFPYLTLLIFFIATFVNDGDKAILGAYRLVKPDWTFLYKPFTWLKAGSQIFFSLGLGMGCLIVFASYTPANNDCHRDAVTISLINCGTSLFAAMVVFPIIGAYGHRQWEDCKNHMQKVLPNLDLWTSKFKDKKYDIYFTPEQPPSTYLFDDVTSVEVRYGYGENTNTKPRSAFYQEDYHFETTTVLNRIDFRGSETARVMRNCSIGEAATESGGGTGFVFIGFTEAVLQMPYSNLWAVMFFAMLFSLGVDTGFGTVEGTVNAFEEVTRLNRRVSTTIVCSILTVLALLLFPFGWGNYVLDLIDQWTANWTLLMVALAECIGIAWIYGLAQVSYDVKLMTGKKPSMFILICWKFITPGIILALLIGSIIQFGLDSAGGINYKIFDPKSAMASGSFAGEVKVPFPSHSLAVGFLLMVLCMIWLPLQAILHKTKYSLVRPDGDGPSDFPETRLRSERHIEVLREEDQFSDAEKAVMGKASLQHLQQYRDKTKKEEEMELKIKASSKSLV